jgi:hypothetical protein
MPKSIADTGLGATIAGTGLVTTEITSIGELTIEVDALDITHLGTAAMKRMRPGDLRSNPTCEISFNWLGSAPPITSAMIPTAEPYAGVTATITYPEGGGSVAGTVFVKSVKFPNAAQGEIMKGSYTIQFDGATAPAFTTTS